MNSKISSLIFCVLALLVTVAMISSLIANEGPNTPLPDDNDTPDPLRPTDQDNQQDENNQEENNPIDIKLQPVYTAKTSLESFIERQAYGTDKEYKKSLPQLIQELNQAATALNSLDTPDTGAASLYAFLSQKFTDFLDHSLAEETKYNTYVSTEILQLLKSIDTLGDFAQDYCPKLDTSVNGALTLTFISLYQQKYVEDKNLISVSLGGSLVLGDDASNTFTNLYGANQSSLLAGVTSVFGSDHASFVSLVNPLIHPSASLTPATGVTSPIKGSTDYVKNILNAASIESVALTGEHIMDYGQDGLAYTTGALGNIQYASDNGVGTVAKIKVGDEYVSLISYNWIEHSDSTTDLATYKSILSEAITDAKKDSSIVIVYINWTGQKSVADSQDGRYTANLSPFQTNVARAAVDAGATLVVGATPHTYQTIESYNNGYTAFSLGDLSYSATQSGNPSHYGFIFNVRFAVGSTGRVSIDSFTMFPYENSQKSGNNVTYTPNLIFDATAKDMILSSMNDKNKIERSRYSISFLRDHFIYIAK